MQSEEIAYAARFRSECTAGVPRVVFGRQARNWQRARLDGPEFDLTDSSGDKSLFQTCKLLGVEEQGGV
jgi:hypothetical protein